MYVEVQLTFVLNCNKPAFSLKIGIFKRFPLIPMSIKWRRTPISYGFLMIKQLICSIRQHQLVLFLNIGSFSFHVSSASTEKHKQAFIIFSPLFYSTFNRPKKSPTTQGYPVISLNWTFCGPGPCRRPIEFSTSSHPCGHFSKIPNV